MKSLTNYIKREKRIVAIDENQFEDLEELEERVFKNERAENLKLINKNRHLNEEELFQELKKYNEFYISLLKSFDFQDSLSEDGEKQEKAIAELDVAIEAAAADYQELTRLLGEKETAETVLMDLMEQWEIAGVQIGL